MQYHRTQATFRIQSARSGNICEVGTGEAFVALVCGWWAITRFPISQLLPFGGGLNSPRARVGREAPVESSATTAAYP